MQIDYLAKRNLAVFGIWILIGICAIPASAQQILRERLRIDWSDEAKTIDLGNGAVSYPIFEGAIFDESRPTEAIWIKKWPLSRDGALEAELINMRFEPIGFAFEAANIGNNIEVRADISHYRGNPQGLVKFFPIRRGAGGQLERLVEAELVVRQRGESAMRPRRSFTTQSVLASGDIYKIEVSETGLHKLDYNFLQGLGIDMAGLDPRQIQIFGNGGAALPEILSVSRVDDLQENAIFVEGEQDGRFDAGDYVVFYAQGTQKWTYTAGSNVFTHQQNIYTDKSYYYIKVNAGAGLRVYTAAAVPTTSYTSTAYDNLQHHEADDVNLMEQEQPALPPSGREWFGNSFKTRRNQSFTFSYDNRLTSEPVKINSRVAARAFSSSTFTFSVGGVIVQNNGMNAISSYVYGLYASTVLSRASFTTASNNITIDIDYANPSSSAEGWLDYLSLHARCALRFGSGQMAFRDAATYTQNASRFELSNANSNVQVWEVTQPNNITIPQSSLNGTTLSFSAYTNGVLREFVAFDGTSFLTPTAVGTVSNQNLHGITTAPQLLIVYHPLFRAAAERLADHRSRHSGITSLAVDINQIYNEFASGQPDVTATRDFAKMLYDRSSGTDSLQYLLLLGAGSFDYKGLGTAGAGNHNLVPLFQTQESLDPLRTYTSDDYFALLDDNEGNVDADQDLDIAVGRIPAITTTQADQVIDKIVRYDLEPDAFNDWRNYVAFVADDEDRNLHFRDADSISRMVPNYDVDYNLSKIYIDAYQQQSTGGGGRYPDANDAILRRLFQGTLIINYVGHGADDGWAQERIFTNAEINTLSNDNKFPLFVTATCSFSPHDDPSLTSAGELLLLNPRGGAIALLTTVRVVLADANAHLTRNTFENLFIHLPSGRMPTIGEVLTLAKNNSGLLSASNSRKYALLGDPSLTLAYPKYDVATTAINGQAPQANLDTIRALQQVTISGEVRLPDGSLASNFNGIVYPTVFDKVDTLFTRGNDGTSYAAPFTLQSKIIFRGRASVVNGRFTFSFIVPRDINYTYGNGKISYYAADLNTLIDANGSYQGFIIGGTDPNANTDQVGPDVDVFMNDERFAFGSVTDPNPTLLVKLYDQSGINTVGNSIGHDLSAELLLPKVSQTTTTTDGESKTYSLNDSYLADVDDFQRGTVRYQLRNLSDGKHTVNVEAWDVYNNVGHGSTEFVVASSAEIALQHVLNYPNPFTTSTNFQFDHNMPGQALDVQIQIFSVAGRLVKTISESRLTDAYHIRDIHWDGLDDFGQPLARGTYLYKISVRNGSGEQAESSVYQKLVILR